MSLTWSEIKHERTGCRDDIVTFVKPPNQDAHRLRCFLSVVGDFPINVSVIAFFPRTQFLDGKVRMMEFANESAQMPRSNLETDNSMNYRSTRERVAMLATRQISAVELLECIIAPILRVLAFATTRNAVQCTKPRQSRQGGE